MHDIPRLSRGLRWCTSAGAPRTRKGNVKVKLQLASMPTSLPTAAKDSLHLRDMGWRCTHSLSRHAHEMVEILSTCISNARLCCT